MSLIVIQNYNGGSSSSLEVVSSSLSALYGQSDHGVEEEVFGKKGVRSAGSLTGERAGVKEEVNFCI